MRLNFHQRNQYFFSNMTDNRDVLLYYLRAKFVCTLTTFWLSDSSLISRYQTLKTIFEVVSSMSPRQHAYFVHVAAYIKTHTGTHAYCFSNTYAHI